MLSHCTDSLAALPVIPSCFPIPLSPASHSPTTSHHLTAYPSPPYDTVTTSSKLLHPPQSSFPIHPHLYARSFPSLLDRSSANLPFPQIMPSTRSQDALPFAATKASSSKSSSSVKSRGKKAPPTSLELSTALFRSEVRAMLSGPPPCPAHIKLKSTDKVDVIGAFERLSSSGIQQSIQLCQVLPGGSRAGGQGETWVTRMEGDRAYFPRQARLSKRLRRVDESDEESSDEDKMLEDEAHDDEAQATPHSRKKARTSTTSSKSKAAPEAPRKARKVAPASSPSTSTRRRRNAAAHSDEEFDEGARTETEASHLASKHAPYGAANLASSSTGSSTSSRRRSHHHHSSPSSSSHASTPATASTSGLRRSTRHERKSEDVDEPVVKREEEDDGASVSGGYAPSMDDLSSLCGRVEGFKVEETVEPGKSAPPCSPSFLSPPSIVYLPTYLSTVCRLPALLTRHLPRLRRIRLRSPVPPFFLRYLLLRPGLFRCVDYVVRRAVLRHGPQGQGTGVLLNRHRLPSSIRLSGAGAPTSSTTFLRPLHHSLTLSVPSPNLLVSSCVVMNCCRPSPPSYQTVKKPELVTLELL